MLKRFILFLIRRKLGVKLYEEFRFTNQCKADIYWFQPDGVYKETENGHEVKKSTVSLNWLLSEECEIERCEG